MIQKIISLLGVFLLVAAATLAQEAATPQAAAVPAASRIDMDCSGFFAGGNLPYDAYVFDGADNDFHQPLRQFATGDSVFLRGANPAVGTEYALVRSAHQTFETSFWYEGQGAFLRSIGTPYQDVGRVKVTQVTAQGAIAEVTFACGPVIPGDLAVAYKPRPIPEYTPTKGFDPFAQPNGKQWGIITAGKNNVGILGTGSIAYINFGQNDGVNPGQRFRIFHFARGRVATRTRAADLPRETTGELIVLSTQEKSSVGIVVKALREIHAGDGVELE